MMAITTNNSIRVKPLAIWELASRSPDDSWIEDLSFLMAHPSRCPGETGIDISVVATVLVVNRKSRAVVNQKAQDSPPQLDLYPVVSACLTEEGAAITLNIM